MPQTVSHQLDFDALLNMPLPKVVESRPARCFSCGQILSDDVITLRHKGLAMAYHKSCFRMVGNSRVSDTSCKRK